MQTVQKAVLICALTLLLIWPAIYNGQPFFSPDTPSYIRAFDAGVVWLFGHESEWTTWARAGLKNDTNVIVSTTSLQSPAFVIAGRSLVYGAFLYLGHLARDFWATVVLQASLVLAAIAMTLRQFDEFTWSRLFLISVSLCFTSTIPFYACLLLPDVFASLAILAVCNVLAFGERLSPFAFVFWVTLLIVAVIVHPSHLALAAVLLCAAIVLKIFRVPSSFSGMTAILLAVLAGLISEAAFSVAVERALGTTVSRPPVVMARLIADGPGAAYLRDNCPKVRFVACEFADRLMVNADEFLWNSSPGSNSYKSAPPWKRKALGDEQYRFALAVFAYDPWAVSRAVLKDTFEQFTMPGLSEFGEGAVQVLPGLPTSEATRMSISRVYHGDYLTPLFSPIVTLSCAISVLCLLYLFLQFWTLTSTELRLTCFLVVFALFSNAAICGALSGPHDRYQARLLWLLPFLTVLTFFSVTRQRQCSTAEQLTPALSKSALSPAPRLVAAESTIKVAFLAAVAMAEIGWLYILAQLAIAFLF